MRESGHAERSRHAHEQLFFVQKFGFADRLAHRLDFQRRRNLVLPRQNDDELIAAVTHDAIFRIEHAIHRLRNFAQNLAPHLMAVGVDHFLKIIDIEKNQRQPFAAELWRAEKFIHVTAKVTRVVETSDVISHSQDA